MKKSLFIALSLISITAFAQKKLTCKKGDIKQDGQLIAKYDGVGSMFKEVKLGVFATTSKDTIIRVTEVAFDAKNPLFPDPQYVYKVEFPNTQLSSFYVRNPKNPHARHMERDVMEMLFNDSVPVLMSGNQLDQTAAEKFKSSFAYDFDNIVNYIKGVEDSLAIVSKGEISRDLSKQVSFKMVNDNSKMGEVDQVYEIYQDNVLLGRMVKKVMSGHFPKANYTFWKKINPVTIGGIDMQHSPVAFCNSGASMLEIPVTTVIGKQEYKIKGAFNALEMQIASLLIQNKLL